MSKKSKTTRPAVIAFRLTREEIRMAEAKALQADMEVNDWARHIVQAELGNKSPLTPNERIIYEELSRVRWMVGKGLLAIAEGKMTPEHFDQLRDQAEKHAVLIADQLLGAYGKEWFSANQPVADEGSKAE